MDRKKRSASSKNSPLEPFLAKISLEAESNRIRRPPNAFMIFGRDHRKIFSKMHPNLDNKSISSMLGKLWKDCSEETKKKYFDKAKELGELHKRRFPDYVYSPREARIKKMMRKFKKDDASMAEFRLNLLAARNTRATRKASTKTEPECDAVDEDKKVSPSQDSKSSPDYVPNNPDFFTEKSPEILCEENQETNAKGNAQQRITGRMSPHCSDCLDHRPCSYALPPSFCNNSGHYPAPVNYRTSPCSSPVPRYCRPPYHPYWCPPTMNPHYFQGTSNMCDDAKPYSYTVPHSSAEFYGPPFRYFERSFTPSYRSPSFSTYPRCKEGFECPHSFQNEFAAENSESRSCFGRMNENYENLSYTYPFHPHTENEVYAQNGRFSMTNAPNREYFPCFEKPHTQTRQQEGFSLNPGSSINNNEMHSFYRRNHQFECNRQTHTCTQVSDDKNKDSSSSYQVAGIEHLCDSSTSSNNNKTSNFLRLESIRSNIEPFTKTNQPSFDIRFQETQRAHLKPSSSSLKNSGHIENSSSFTNEVGGLAALVQRNFSSGSNFQRSHETNTAHEDHNAPTESASNENCIQVRSTNLQSDENPKTNQETSIDLSSPHTFTPVIKVERSSPDSSFTYNENCAEGTSTVESREPSGSQEIPMQADEATAIYYDESICESEQSNQSNTYSNSSLE